MTHCTGHALAKRLTDTPVILTAGGASTPPPLGAAILALATPAKPIVTGLPGWRPTIVRLNWQDMTVPALSTDDWHWLADRLARMPRLHVHCQAGHGRTGTALAILCTLWNVVPEDVCPVTWIRDRYCPEAVETDAQLAYVARVTGRKVTATCAKPPMPPSGGTRATNWRDDSRLLDPYASSNYYGEYSPAPPRVPRTPAPTKPSRYFPGNAADAPLPTEPGTLRKLPPEDDAIPKPKARPADEEAKRPRYPVKYPPIVPGGPAHLAE